jgi:hypothetical protein
MANTTGELQHAVIEWASACRERGMGIITSKTVHITEGIQRRLNMK